jgi:hypothetical protein
MKEEREMMKLQDVYNIEGDAESEEEYFTSIQRAINSLEAWKFQGSYGRAMMNAIQGGHCMLGRHDTHDYYGNHIPSRDQVKDGTPGSKGYVVSTYGEEWASLIESV